jgi:hypothetical protein
MTAQHPLPRLYVCVVCVLCALCVCCLRVPVRVCVYTVQSGTGVILRRKNITTWDAACSPMPSPAEAIYEGQVKIQGVYDKMTVLCQVLLGLTR